METMLELWQMRAMEMNTVIAEIGALLADVPEESFADVRRMYDALEAINPGDAGIVAMLAIARKTLDAMEALWRVVDEQTPKIAEAAPAMIETLERKRKERSASCPDQSSS